MYIYIYWFYSKQVKALLFECSIWTLLWLTVCSMSGILNNVYMKIAATIRKPSVQFNFSTNCSLENRTYNTHTQRKSKSGSSNNNRISTANWRIVMLRTLERVSLGFWFAIYKLRNTRFNEFSVWFFVCPNEIRGVPFFTKSNRVKAYTRETRLMFKQTPPIDTVNNEPHFAISTQRTYIEIHRKFLACFMNRLYRASFSLNHHAFWWQIIPGALFFFSIGLFVTSSEELRRICGSDWIQKKTAFVFFLYFLDTIDWCHTHRLIIIVSQIYTFNEIVYVYSFRLLFICVNNSILVKLFYCPCQLARTIMSIHMYIHIHSIFVIFISLLVVYVFLSSNL